MRRRLGALLLWLPLATLPGCCFGGGYCPDPTPRPYDNELEGVATVVAVDASGATTTLTFDFQPPSWSAPERQAPVAASAIAGLPAGLALTAGATLPLRGVFHLEQICATTPHESRPPTWSYVGEGTP